MLKRNWHYIYTALVILIDFILLNLSFILAIYLRFSELRSPLDYWQPWVFINVLFFPLALALGVYRNIFNSSLDNQKIHLKKFTYYLALFIMSYLFMIKGHQYSRGVVVIFLMTQYVLLELAHSILNRINRHMFRKGYGSKNVLIVGTDVSASRFAEHLQDLYGDYYKIQGFIANGTPHRHDPMIIPRIVGKYENVEELISTSDIKEVFIVSDSMMQKKYEPIRKACEAHHVNVKMVSPYIKNLMHQIKVKDVTGVPLTTVNGRKRYDYWNAKLKRAFDLVVVLLAGTVLLPVGLIIALLIKLTSKGPVFFKQKRALYKGGPEFWFYKFRTMYENADELKEKYWSQNETNGALFKMKKDPRVTPIGRFLRKYSLDEIPQFINVLKGEMSIVGPRPLPVSDFNKLQNGSINYDWYQKRGKAKPGITGLWQISGRSNLSFEEMCLLDLYYIENQSIFFDLEILFETIPVVFMGKGAY
ncbi:MAG: sugar transferase [Calditrichaeota bacterium]|nr:MAG: sugar transferase [Calditrichota bacterium]